MNAKESPIIKVIIPAMNEEKSIGKVVKDIPSMVKEVIVVNNRSTDHTAAEAKKAGATVLQEDRAGYGYACLKGIEYVKAQDTHPDIIVFMDGDYSDYPEELPKVIAPIIENGVDMVIGSRALGQREAGSMTIPQIFGNWLATTLLRWFYGVRFSDLGPFRAIRYEKLLAMNMIDKTYGWTVEMQVKAAKLGMKSTEVPVTYRQRIGYSKVSGTVKGTIMAGYKILWTIFKYSLR
ncbi:glycosyltransferase family 2 protein [Algivirga pacifica]|uniref:Glycosyltransferase family 2 protein n=1 Tax=Algivirga pacifica TaxID=1162670 RepID=A0ABP9DA44_9BACT